MSSGTIGLIGVGLVGTALAERWHSAGWNVMGYDTDPTFVARLQAAGGTAAASGRDVVQSADTIFLSLPTSQISQRVINDLSGEWCGKTVVDTTTGDPDEMTVLSFRVAEEDGTYLDATIAGSSEQIRSGEVLVMIGGPETAITSCEEMLSAFASQVIHTGPCGSAARMKLVVNLVLGLNRAVLAEGLSFAQRMRIDPRGALDVLMASPAASRVMQTKGEKMLTGDFTPQARLSQHYKDVRMILAEGQKTGAYLPLSKLHAELLAEREAAGDGALDNSAIIRAYTTARD